MQHSITPSSTNSGTPPGVPPPEHHTPPPPSDSPACLHRLESTPTGRVASARTCSIPHPAFPSFLQPKIAAVRQFLTTRTSPTNTHRNLRRGFAIARSLDQG
jgi:hypothetical protein